MITFMESLQLTTSLSLSLPPSFQTRTSLIEPYILTEGQISISGKTPDRKHKPEGEGLILSPFQRLWSPLLGACGLNIVTVGTHGTAKVPSPAAMKQCRITGRGQGTREPAMTYPTRDPLPPTRPRLPSLPPFPLVKAESPGSNHSPIATPLNFTAVHVKSKENNQ